MWTRAVERQSFEPTSGTRRRRKDDAHFEKHGGFMSFLAVGLQGAEDDMDGARSICSWIWVVYLHVH